MSDLFRGAAVLDTGLVRLDLVSPLEVDEGLRCDPRMLSLLDAEADRILERMGIRSQVTPTRVYARGPRGLELRSVLLTIPGTQDLRRSKDAQRPMNSPRRRKR